MQILWESVHHKDAWQYLLLQEMQRSCLCIKEESRSQRKETGLIAKSVPKVREYISIREAVAIYGVERDTLYLMVRRGQIPSINIGTRLTRISRKDLEKMFVKRPIAKHIKETPLPKKYSLEPEDCYTIGEVCEKYHINDSSVCAHVRKYSIPSRQIGNYVYVPKEEIDNLSLLSDKN